MAIFHSYVSLPEGNIDIWQVSDMTRCPFAEYVSVYIYINETQDVPGTSGTAFQSQDVGD